MIILLIASVHSDTSLALRSGCRNSMSLRYYHDLRGRNGKNQLNASFPSRESRDDLTVLGKHILQSNRQSWKRPSNCRIIKSSCQIVALPVILLVLQEYYPKKGAVRQVYARFLVILFMLVIAT